jgi:hypothetical protein
MNILCKGRKDRLGSSNVFSVVYIVADERKVTVSLPRPLPSLERTIAKHAIFATSEFIGDGVRK